MLVTVRKPETSNMQKHIDQDQASSNKLILELGGDYSIRKE